MDSYSYSYYDEDQKIQWFVLSKDTFTRDFEWLKTLAHRYINSGRDTNAGLYLSVGDGRTLFKITLEYETNFTDRKHQHLVTLNFVDDIDIPARKTVIKYPLDDELGIDDTVNTLTTDLKVFLEEIEFEKVFNFVESDMTLIIPETYGDW